jgi:hypothetical protein
MHAPVPKSFARDTQLIDQEQEQEPASDSTETRSLESY